MEMEMWNIMSQIASGISYIHSQGEVHRDLKPLNGQSSWRYEVMVFTNSWLVLYSRNDKTWKIADFGLTSEDTSNALRFTELARGTSGYRAPEMLLEGNRSYNNKADIWAMGCILHELAIGSKAFSGDPAVLEYRRSGVPLTVTVGESFDKSSCVFIRNNIHEMLQAEPSSRPRASVLYESFSKYHIYIKSQQASAIAKVAQDNIKRLTMEYKSLQNEWNSQRQLIADRKQAFDIKQAKMIHRIDIIEREKKLLQFELRKIERDREDEIRSLNSYNAKLQAEVASLTQVKEPLGKDIESLHTKFKSFEKSVPITDDPTNLEDVGIPREYSTR